MNHEAFDTDLLVSMLASPLMLQAAWVTIWVATVAQAFGTVIGLATGPMLMSKRRTIWLPAWVYLWFFRGTPLLAQILFYYAALPQLGIKLGVLTTGLLALGINEGARMAEVVRSGLLSVSSNQSEAAAALGLRPLQIFATVVLPQALRAIVPPLGNNYTYMIKATSLLAVISFTELLRTAQQFAQSTGRPLEIYTAAAIWYLTIISFWTMLQRKIESRLSRDGPVDKLGTDRMPEAEPESMAPEVIGNVTHRKGRVVLVATGLRKQLGGTKALDGVDFTARVGEVVVVLGPSGSGKSTLLRCLNHLEEPDEGMVRLNGELIGVVRQADGTIRRLPARVVDIQRQRFGMVFQHFNLFRHMTSRDNVALLLIQLKKLDAADAHARALALLERIGIAEKATSYPVELSGGEKQRVAIARALALEPNVLLFDEPTSALDPEAVRGILDIMSDLARAGTTMIVVTHELGFAREVGDHIVFMKNGRIIEQGSAKAFFESPRSKHARAFLQNLSRSEEITAS
jgi:polar amino acid transport system permease protein